LGKLAEVLGMEIKMEIKNVGATFTVALRKG
jgi:hypothetical protein